MNVTLRFFNGGFCRQLLCLVDRRTPRFVRFHAVFLAVRHPVHGWVVIDTGYGGRFREGTLRWPYRIYRYATPATMNGSASETLGAAGINVAEVRHVLITHFHADHIGGLRDFPAAVIHHHEDAWRLLAQLRPWRQTRAAYLPSLVPPDFPDRSEEFRPPRSISQESYPSQSMIFSGTERSSSSIYPATRLAISVC